MLIMYGVPLSIVLYLAHSLHRGKAWSLAEFEMLGEDFVPVKGQGNGVLRYQGNLVIKLLEGPGIMLLRSQLKPCFQKLHNVRPKATRRESKEVYLVCIGRKPAYTKAT